MRLDPIYFWILVLAIGYASIGPITAIATIIVAVMNLAGIVMFKNQRIRKMPYSKKRR